MDKWLLYQQETQDTQGTALAISYKGKIIFNRAYGLADNELQVSLMPEHYFRIASQSKTFSAVMILRLVEQKKIKLDDPLTNYLPWLANHTDKRWANVSVRQLLSHGSGMIRDGKCDYWQLMAAWPSGQDIKREVMSAPLAIDNNRKHKYTNLGYALAGLLIEAVADMPYAEFAAQEILMPLKL